MPLLIHQPSYSILNRWIEEELLGTLAELGTGCIAFSPLAQGLLSDKYLEGVPEGARAAKEGSFSQTMLSEANLARIRALGEVAAARGQSLAQMAIAWVLRADGRAARRQSGRGRAAGLLGRGAGRDRPGGRGRRQHLERIVRLPA